MNTLKTTSRILLIVAALGLSVAGCERRAVDSSGTSGMSGSSSSGTGTMGSTTPSPGAGSGTDGTGQR